MRSSAWLLRERGHDVDVFERSTGELTGFGAGIVAHEVSVCYFTEQTTTALAAPFQLAGYHYSDFKLNPPESDRTIARRSPSFGVIVASRCSPGQSILTSASRHWV